LHLLPPKEGNQVLRASQIRGKISFPAFPASLSLPTCFGGKHLLLAYEVGFLGKGGKIQRKASFKKKVAFNVWRCKGAIIDFLHLKI